MDFFGVNLSFQDLRAGGPAAASPDAVVSALALLLALAIALVLLLAWPMHVVARRRRARLCEDIALRLRASALHCALGDVREASRLAHEALAAALRARLRPQEAVARECLADAQLAAGDGKLAVEGWHASLVIVRELRMHEDAARVCRKLAQSCESDGAQREALRWKYRAAVLDVKAQDVSSNRRRRRAAQALRVPGLSQGVAQAAVHAAKLAAAGRLLVGVNHELKQPLVSMRLLASNGLQMLDGGQVARARRSLADLLALADQLAGVTSALDAFARNEPVRAVAVAAGDCVRAALRVIAPQVAHARSHRIVWGGDDARIWSDPDRVRLILVNLLSNAIDATADSPNKRIEIRVRDEGEWVTLRVRDYGSGLSDGAGKDLFQPFATSKPEGRGLGLGLALSAKLAREMRGRLSGRNHSGGGAEFVLKLPSCASSG